ncbi:DUF2577 domain-containing protein [Dialister invisus]|nr:DUF2577 domain-containing protein [Dialister invisus]DAY53520.1 MAG TPA: Protein of unknown function (DUF2577) [Caudoviricetes sp.]
MINDELPNVLKSLVAQTVRGMNPSDFVLGEVISEAPLVIRVGENELDEDFLILSDNVRDFEVDIEVNHITEKRAGGGGYAEYASHDHDYKGRKKIIIYNGLKIGEKVVMIQQSGGQLFFVANRVYNHADVHGQWGD